MPVYEYACKSCGKHVEAAQSFKDEPLTTCEFCGGPLRKVFGSIGVVLKGSGFYRTDSRSDSKPRGKSATAEAKADESTKSESSESKSDTAKSESTKSESASDAKPKPKPKAAESAKSA